MTNISNKWRIVSMLIALGSAGLSGYLTLLIMVYMGFNTDVIPFAGHSHKDTWWSIAFPYITILAVAGVSITTGCLVRWWFIKDAKPITQSNNRDASP
jgi:hypothetical protein